MSIWQVAGELGRIAGVRNDAAIQRAIRPTQGFRIPVSYCDLSSNLLSGGVLQILEDWFHPSLSVPSEIVVELLVCIRSGWKIHQQMLNGVIAGSVVNTTGSVYRIFHLDASFLETLRVNEFVFADLRREDVFDLASIRIEFTAGYGGKLSFD